MSNAEFKGHAALITGAGSGVGRAVAMALAGAGAAVVLVGRREEKLRETAALLPEGAQSLCVAGNVADLAFVEGLEARLRKEGLLPSFLVNNAGVHGEFTSIRESDPDRWRETMRTNLEGPYLFARAFMGPMIERGWGRIINVSSAASIGAPGGLNSAYPLSKVALNFFTRQLAAELAGTGVTANAIHPGEVKTEMWQAIRDDAQSRGAECEGARGWVSMVGESGGDPPEKAAALVMKLCGREMDAVTGEFHWIEGGIQAPRRVW